MTWSREKKGNQIGAFNETGPLRYDESEKLKNIYGWRME